MRHLQPTTPRRHPLRRALATTTLLATTVVASLGATGAAAASASAATASGADARSSSCRTDEYRTRIRNVRGTQQIGLTRVRAVTYPGRTTIKKGQSVTVSTDRVFSAGVKNTVSATFGASAMLKKVVGIYGEISGRTQLRASIGSTRSESTTVSSSTKMVIPGGRSVAWFRGYRVVGGTFEYSWCHHYSGMPSQVGTVEWERARFTTYGYRSSGGQRCDVKAYEPVAQAAKRAVCS